MEKPIIEFKGRNGKIELYKKFVRLDRGTAMGFLMQGLKGQKDIYFDKITSIQIKKPGFTVGYLQFSIGGGNESKSGVSGALKDENTIAFATKDLYEQALKIKEYIDEQIQKKSEPATNSVAEEISKLKHLLDTGTITAEEFKMAKKKLL